MPNDFQIRNLSARQRSSRAPRPNIAVGSVMQKIIRLPVSACRLLWHIVLPNWLWHGTYKQRALRAFLWMCLLGFLAVCCYLLYIWYTLPDVSDPRKFFASQSTVVVDRRGTELYRFFQEEDRTYIGGAQIPQHLKDAIISIEDERFYERGCLDIRAILRAVVGLGRAGGASTLTRQLARNALDLRRENIYNRKMKELVLGCQLEGMYTKDQLIELYLNWIPFGQNAYGIEQASQRYFGHSASGLTLAQSAALAALPQRPSYFSPYGSHRHTTVDPTVEALVLTGAITSLDQMSDDDITIGLIGAHIGTGANTVYIGGRTDQVLQNMEDQGLITNEQRLAALEDAQNIIFTSARESIRAPHFVLWVRELVEDMLSDSAEEDLLERGGLTIETTLDWELQMIAEDVFLFHKEDIFDRYGARNAALLALDKRTREILAYVGNMDYSDTEYAGKVNMVLAPRQPGSSFKPLVYAGAFESGYTPATVLFDVPTEVGDDEPQNFDGEFMGPLTIRQALGASRNIPAAKAFFLAGGEEKVLQLASSMGAPSPLTKRAEYTEQRGEVYEYGWPLALGAAETPLAEMVQTYSTFADGGRFIPSFAIRRIVDKNGNILFEAEEEPGEQVLDERIAYQITSVLSDESVRPEEYWRTQLTVPGFQTAAKTGTSNKCLERDEETGACKLRKPDNAWLLGYTPELVTGVWVGNADSSAMYEKAGGLNTASPIWHDFMVRAHRKIPTPEIEFETPDRVVQAQISLLSGQLPTECTPVELRRADVFLEENSPKEADPACFQLTVDKVTGLLASDACPEDAQEEGSFYKAHSVLPNRFPKWEEAVDVWMQEQTELWYAAPDHSGSLLKLPRAPTEVCDPALTPGRLEEPIVNIVSPENRGTAAYPAFIPSIDYDVGSSIREVQYFIDKRKVATVTEAPYTQAIRVPRTIRRSGMHRFEVVLIDEYYNQARHEISISFGEDTAPPTVRFTSPLDGTSHRIGDPLTLTVKASDAEGGVKYVQFYLNDILLSTKPKEPFTMTYEIKEPGSYTLRAKAEDMAKHTSEDEVQITVGN